MVVEDASPARGGGTLLLPKIVLPVATRRPFEVELRPPSGIIRTAKAVFELPHVRGDLPPFAAIRLVEVVADEVVLGTEVWWTRA
ncbi:MAG: hypothetical protein ACHREM_01880 [Polyangiales bacterium]